MGFGQRLMGAAALIEARLADLLVKLRPGLREGWLRGCGRARSAGQGLRPFLTLECAELFGVRAEAAVETAAALDCVRCYSLVHDDLPAMDDGDRRRGKPTVHKAFDEWTAILAGDALLTLAFELLASPQTHADPGVRTELIAGLARASGKAGMVGGQSLDLEA
jgi:farnesyl diphosphate synthase